MVSGPSRKRDLTPVGGSSVRWTVRSIASIAAGRWPSPHSPTGLRCCQRLPSGHRPGAHTEVCAALHGLGHRACGHRPRVGVAVPRRTSPPTFTGSCLPSTVSPSRALETHQAPPTEWATGTPLTDSRSCTLSSTPDPPEGESSGPRSHPGPHVPSSWSLSTSTACSERALRACCIPLTVLGFATFRQPKLTPRGAADPTKFHMSSAVPGHRSHRVPKPAIASVHPGPLPPWRLIIFTRLPDASTPRSRCVSATEPIRGGPPSGARARRFGGVGTRECHRAGGTVRRPTRDAHEAQAPPAFTTTHKGWRVQRPDLVATGVATRKVR